MSNQSEIQVGPRQASLELPPIVYGTMPHHELRLVDHLKRIIAFSKGTWGPDTRMEGVLDHMLKEMAEVRKSGGHPSEWVDLVILAVDGLTRSILATGVTTDVAAQAAVNIWLEKQNKNERRVWPDWRGVPADKAIEHVRGTHD